MSEGRTKRRPALLAAVSALAAMMLVSAACSASVTASNTGSIGGRIDWKPCEADPSAQCGRLEVPVDWSDPAGETIDLFVSRRRATDPARRIGSLLVNFGGPGSPGGLLVANSKEQVEAMFNEEIRARFDIVGFDPRGVGWSHGIDCSEDLLAKMPSPMLKSQKDFRERVAYNKRLREDCRKRNGKLYDHVDTLSVVHDLEALRSALGDENLTYYGTSYGSHIGYQYAQAYPDRVRAIALDAISDHSLRTAGWVREKAEMMQSSFEGFVAWCRKDERCVLNGRDVRALWNDLLDRADRGRIPAPASAPRKRLEAFDIIDVAFNCFYGPEWSGLADYLHRLDSGGPTPAPPCQDEGEPPPIQIPDSRFLSIANFCADYALPVRNYRQWKALVHRMGRRFAPDMRVNPNAVERIAHCLGHDNVPNPQHRLKYSGEAPILLGNSLYDPVTGHNQAVNVARQIGKEAALLTYEGAGHGVYSFFSGSQCVTRHFNDYLIHTEVPEDGTRCPAVPYQPNA